jgi:hypothetical protein
MKVTHKAAIELHFCLAQLETKLPTLPVKFGYASLRTKKYLKGIVECFQELQAPFPELLEFDKKRVAICEELSEKDENGKPVLEDNNFKIQEGKLDELNEKVEAVREEYKEWFDKAEDRKKEIEEFLQEETEVEVHQVSIDDFPAELSAKDMAVLECLVKD